MGGLAKIDCEGKEIEFYKNELYTCSFIFSILLI